MLNTHQIGTPGTCVGGFLFLSLDKRDEELTPLKFFSSIYHCKNPVVLIHNSQTKLLEFVRTSKTVNQFLASPIFSEGDCEVLLFRNYEAYTFYRNETTREYDKQKKNGEELAILEKRKKVDGVYKFQVGDTIRYAYFPHFIRTTQSLDSSNIWVLVCTDEYLEKRKRELGEESNK